VKAVQLLVRKVEREPDAASSLAQLFNPYGNVLHRLPERFAGEQELLETTYLLASTRDPHMDHDGSAFGLITQMNPSFPLRYLKYRIDPETTDRWNRFDNRGDQSRFGQIWKREDYEEVMRTLIDYAYMVEAEHFFFDEALRVLLGLPEDNGGREEPAVDEDYATRQDAFLQRLVTEHADDESFISWVFGGISGLPPDRRRELIRAYVATNPLVEAFEQIALEPRSLTNWGSWVPVYQRQLEYLESLLPLFNRVELLSHRAYIERRMESLRKQIREEKRSDFFDD
jgi:hypothetical protein